MTTRIVLDTNVLISALLTPFGAPARVLDMVLIGLVDILYDDRIMDEYQKVLKRRKFGFAPNGVDWLLDFFRTSGLRINALPFKYQLPDLDDAPFLEVAITGRANALVTGNRRHFPIRSAIPILSPNDFLQDIQEKP